MSRRSSACSSSVGGAPGISANGAAASGAACALRVLKDDLVEEGRELELAQWVARVLDAAAVEDRGDELLH